MRWFVHDPARECEGHSAVTSVVAGSSAAPLGLVRCHKLDRPTSAQAVRKTLRRLQAQLESQLPAAERPRHQIAPKVLRPLRLSERDRSRARPRWPRSGVSLQGSIGHSDSTPPRSIWQMSPATGTASAVGIPLGPRWSSTRWLRQPTNERRQTPLPARRLGVYRTRLVNREDCCWHGYRPLLSRSVRLCVARTMPGHGRPLIIGPEDSCGP